MEASEKSVRFAYVNHRKEREWRWVTPLELTYGFTQWHTEPQWLLRAWDHNRGAERTFAVKDMEHWGRPLP